MSPGASQLGAPGTIIVLAILCLVVPAVSVGLHHLLRYGREGRALRRAELNLKRWREQEPAEEPALEAEAEAEADTDTADLRMADLDDLGRGVETRSLVAARLDAIRRLRAQRVRINVDTLQQLTWARDVAKGGTGLPGFAGSMALLLGILGTFLGLAAMVQQIDLGLPGEGARGMESLASSIANLRQVLGGMRTAFTTSLVGMTAAIVCFVLDFWIDRRCSGFYQRLENFTVQELLPATVPALADESLLEKVSVQLETSFARIDGIVEANRRVLRDLTGAEKAFLAILEEIRRLTNSEARQDLGPVLANLEKTSNSFVELASHLPSIVVSNREGREEMRRVLDALDRTGSSFAEEASRLASVVDAMDRGSRQTWLRLDGFLRRWFPASVVFIVVCMWIALEVIR